MFKNQSGQLFILSIIVLGALVALTLLITSSAVTYKQRSQYSIEEIQAINLAEAGIDKAIATLNTSAGTYNGETKTTLPDGDFSVVVRDKNTTTKTIEVTGYVPSKSNPKVQKTIKIDVSKGIGASFNYALQTGDGGLDMGFNSRINGSVYANGDINMGFNSRITGDVYVAGGTQATPDQEVTCSSCQDYIFGKSVSSQSRLDVAQSFRPSQTATLNKVSIKLKKVGSPANLTVRIMGNTGSRPNMSDIKADATLYSSQVTNQYGDIEVSFVDPPTLNAGTTYWIMLDSSSNNSNYWTWALSSNTYSQGQPMWTSNWQSSSASWIAIVGDLNFKTFMGGSPTGVYGNFNSRVTGNVHANTIRDLTITGNAYYQAASDITAANQYPGSPDPGVQTMPLSDANIQSWKDLALEEGEHFGDITNCPSTLTAGKYNGSITLPNNCTVTVSSPIWITGDLILSYNSKIKLNSSYGTQSGVIIADRQVRLYWLDKIEGSGSPGSYLITISEYNSKDDPQEEDAIQVNFRDNEGILYANRGKISIGVSNRLTSVTAWKLSVGFDSVLTYDQGLAGAFFSSGPSGSFAAVKGTYQIK